MSLLSNLSLPLRISLLITVWVDDRRGNGISHLAVSTTPMQNSRSIIRLADLEGECDFSACSVRWRDLPFAMFDFEEVDNAANIVVRVVSANVPEIDEVAFMQRGTRQNPHSQRGSGNQRGGKREQRWLLLQCRRCTF